MHAKRDYAIDYLKLKCYVEPDLFETIYTRVKAAMLRACGGELAVVDKCHKVTVLRNSSRGENYYIIDIWDTPSEAFDELCEPYAHLFDRVDIRHEKPKDTKESILTLGHSLQTHVTKWNVNVYNTRIASKRMGRDRGGIGFAIGSHKSDLRITRYIRGRERGALEYQFQGKQLRKALELAREERAISKDFRSLATIFASNLDAMGSDRLQAALGQALEAERARTNQSIRANLQRFQTAPIWEDSDHRSLDEEPRGSLESESQAEEVSSTAGAEDAS